jgi:hypothetical protein
MISKANSPSKPNRRQTKSQRTQQLKRFLCHEYLQWADGIWPYTDMSTCTIYRCLFVCKNVAGFWVRVQYYSHHSLHGFCDNTSDTNRSIRVVPNFPWESLCLSSDIMLHISRYIQCCNQELSHSDKT